VISASKGKEHLILALIHSLRRMGSNNRDKTWVELNDCITGLALNASSTKVVIGGRRRKYKKFDQVTYIFSPGVLC